MLGSRMEKVGMLYISLLTRPFLDLTAMAATVSLLYVILSLFIKAFWTFFVLMFNEPSYIELFAGTMMFIIAIWSLMSMAIHMIESFADSIEDVIHGGLFNRLQTPENPVQRVEGTLQSGNLAQVVSQAGNQSTHFASKFSKDAKNLKSRDGNGDGNSISKKKTE